MNNEYGWVNASFEHWQAFRDWASSDFDKILYRNQLPLPDWFVPPAHGVVIPSRYYMSKYVGFNASTYQSRGWRPIKRADGYVKERRAHRYLTRRCGSLFSVERSQEAGWGFGAALAYRFSSTPVFTLTVEEAQFLAELKQPPSSLRWVDLRPYDIIYKSDYTTNWAFVSSMKLTR
jgi:hypothetical protein